MPIQTPLRKLLPLVPSALHAAIRAHGAYVRGSDSIVFEAERSRRQAENKEACFQLQFVMLRDVGDGVAPECRRERFPF